MSEATPDHPLRVKLDEALPPSLTRLFVQYGLSCSTVVEQGWSGNEDDDLWQLVQAERELFVTPDKRFGDLRLFAPGSHFGIVLLRADEPSIPAYHALCERLLMGSMLNDLVGALIVVTDRGIRVRRQ